MFEVTLFYFLRSCDFDKIHNGSLNRSSVQNKADHLFWFSTTLYSQLVNFSFFFLNKSMVALFCRLKKQNFVICCSYYYCCYYYTLFSCIGTAEVLKLLVHLKQNFFFRNLWDRFDARNSRLLCSMRRLSLVCSLCGS